MRTCLFLFSFLILGFPGASIANDGPHIALDVGVMKAAEIGPPLFYGEVRRTDNSPANSIGISASWPLSPESPFDFQLGYRYSKGGDLDMRRDFTQPCPMCSSPVGLYEEVNVDYDAHAALAYLAWRSEGEIRFVGRLGAAYQRVSYHRVGGYTEDGFAGDHSDIEGSGSIGVEFGEHWGLEYALIGEDARYLVASYRF